MTVGESFVKYSLPPEVERRERALGRFAARFAQGLPGDLRGIAFCGPASFRDPEADDIWHPGVMRGGFSSLLRDQFPRLILSFFGGIRRFVLKRFGRFILIRKQHSETLAVAPLQLCKLKQGSVETSYCHPDDLDSMSWLLIDDTLSDPAGYPLGRSNFLCRYFMLLIHCLRVFSLRRENEQWKDWTVGFLLTVRWIMGMVWVNKWMLSLKIRSILEKTQPDKVFCVHEMHPHSRIVWLESRRLNITSVTIQHASITRAKLWYFPTPEELLAGMAVPDTFCVFSTGVRNLFEQFFPKGVRYPLTCGPRFSRWKGMVGESFSVSSSHQPILFAGSLPWWDNVVVLKAVLKLVIQENIILPIQVRLHPASDIPAIWKQRLDQLVVDNKVSISKGPLEEDLLKCGVAVGMNTTVLEEAALMGKGVIVVEDRDYLSFATQLGTHVPLGIFSWATVESVIQESQERKEDIVRRGKEVLGIDHPVCRVN